MLTQQAGFGAFQVNWWIMAQNTPSKIGDPSVLRRPLVF